MSTLTLTGLLPDDEHKLVDALRIAIEVYKRDAVTMVQSGQHRMAEQFRRQVDDALRLITLIEEGQP